MFEDITDQNDEEKIESLTKDNKELALYIHKVKKQIKRKRIAVKELMAEHIEGVMLMNECQIWINASQKIIKEHSKGGTLFDSKVLLDNITKETKKRHLEWVKEYHNIDEISVKAVLAKP
jgi:hypothetical protein